MDAALRDALAAGALADGERLRQAARRVALLREVHWEGGAGDGFRRNVIELAAELLDAADLLERAARLLAASPAGAR